MLRAGPVICRVLCTFVFCGFGLAHFALSDVLASMIPPALPHPYALVAISGVCEIAGGIGLWIPRLRRAAGMGLVLLLVCVFPANVYAAQHQIFIPGTEGPWWTLWVRLPFQLVYVALVIGAAMDRWGRR